MQGRDEEQNGGREKKTKKDEGEGRQWINSLAVDGSDNFNLSSGCLHHC